MLEQFRRVLVDSFVGAIALGWVFSQGILHFTYILSAPVAGWVARREYQGMLNRAATGFSLREALPELVKSISLLLVGYLLLRWLYYKTFEPDTRESHKE